MYVNIVIRQPMRRALIPHLVACFQHCRALLDRTSRSAPHTASYSADAPHPGASASRGALPLALEEVGRPLSPSAFSDYTSENPAAAVPTMSQVMWVHIEEPEETEFWQLPLTGRLPHS